MHLLSLAKFGTRDNNSSNISCVCKSPLHCFYITHVQCASWPAHAHIHLLRASLAKDKLNLQVPCWQALQCLDRSPEA